MKKYGFIICSQNPELKTKTTEWILKYFKASTQIQFMENQNSIYEAYNKGISQLDDDVKYVCFCHEDIDIENINIKAITKKLDKLDTGFVGIAGAKKLSDNAVWWDGFTGKPHPNLSGKAGHQKIEKIKSFEEDATIDQLKRWYNTYGELGQVEVLDGVILFCRRNFLYEQGFPDGEFDGWDFYDITMTWLANYRGYKNYTLGRSDIELYHWGLGHVRDTWEANRIKFLKWKEMIAGS